MAEKYGGGAESYARFKQYDYRAVSILCSFWGALPSIQQSVEQCDVDLAQQ